MKKIHFSEMWDKLRYAVVGETITTIRGRDYLQRRGIRLGETIEVHVRRKPVLVARVLHFKVLPIREIDLETLNRDIAPDHCSTHGEFAEKLGAFYRRIGIPVRYTPDSEVQLIYMKVLRRFKQ